MSNYYFESREFGVSDNGIHLLRSGFNYETIEFGQVESLVIEKGKELNNWGVVLVIGLALLSFSFYYVLGLIDVFSGNEIRSIYIEEIVVPVVPFLLGAYCVRTSMRSGTILRVRTTSNKTDKFQLGEFEKDNKLESFQAFLKEKLNTKIRINV